MELLAQEGRRLHELNDLLPVWYFRHRAIRCPWERKGEVMRTIAADHAHENVEMVDGVRVDVDGGWFLVLPDASDPSVNVYVEGASNDEADRLVGAVSDRIERLIDA
jgi:mannose-1-phosphate guanylyltransferase/phosphomannomutase